MALAKGLVPSLLSQAAARAAEPLAHITRTLVQLEVIDHDVGQTALSNYLKNCLAKSKGISGPSYNPANGSHTLHRHIAAAVPVASLLKVRGKELLSALHRTREEPEAAPSYTELQASADASAAAARREQQRSSQLRAQVKTLQEVSVNAVRKDAEREAKEKADATVQRVRASAERQVAAAQAGAEDADGPWYVCCVYAHIRVTTKRRGYMIRLSSRHTHAKRVSCRSGCLTGCGP